MAERMVPILPSRDLHETLEFYERLGFQNRGAPPDQWDYLIIGRGDLMIHFYLDRDVNPLTTAFSCYAYVDDARALHDSWVGLVVADRPTGSRLVPPVDAEYGLTEFAVVDRSGNLIRVGSPISSSSPLP